MAETLGIGHAASDGAVPDVVDEPVVPMAGGEASQHSASDLWSRRSWSRTSWSRTSSMS